MAEREEIEGQFLANLEPVRGLVDLYQVSVRRGRGRKAVPESDLLRAAVVLLHAALEDLLRSVVEWKRPTALAASLDRIPLGGTERSKECLTLVDLAEFRGRPVDWVITQLVAGYLERSSYNHPGGIAELLGKIGVRCEIRKEIRVDLAIMMTRRHSIAHRADRNLSRGPGHQRTRSISALLVREWIKIVEEFGVSVLDKIT